MSEEKIYFVKDFCRQITPLIVVCAPRNQKAWIKCSCLWMDQYFQAVLCMHCLSGWWHTMAHQYFFIAVMISRSSSYKLEVVFCCEKTKTWQLHLVNPLHIFFMLCDFVILTSRNKYCSISILTKSNQKTGRYTFFHRTERKHWHIIHTLFSDLCFKRNGFFSQFSKQYGLHNAWCRQAVFYEHWWLCYREISQYHPSAIYIPILVFLGGMHAKTIHFYQHHTIVQIPNFPSRQWIVVSVQIQRILAKRIWGIINMRCALVHN